MKILCQISFYVKTPWPATIIKIRFRDQFCASNQLKLPWRTSYIRQQMKWELRNKNFTGDWGNEVPKGIIWLIFQTGPLCFLIHSYYCLVLRKQFESIPVSVTLKLHICIFSNFLNQKLHTNYIWLSSSLIFQMHDHDLINSHNHGIG